MDEKQYLKSVDTAVDIAVKGIDKNPDKKALDFAKKVAKMNAHAYYKRYPEEIHNTNSKQVNEFVQFLKAMEKAKAI